MQGFFLIYFNFYFHLFNYHAKSGIEVFKKCAKFFLRKSFSRNHLRARGAPKSLRLRDLRLRFKIDAPSAFSLAGLGAKSAAIASLLPC